MHSLKFFSCAIAAFLLVLSPFPGFSTEYRTWTADADGFPVEARYRGFNRQTVNGVESQTVKLQTKDGTLLSVAMSDLSKEDQDHVNRLLEKSRSERARGRAGHREDMEKRRAEWEAEAEKSRLEREKEWAERQARRRAEQEKWDQERAARAAEQEAATEILKADAKKRRAEWDVRQKAERAERDKHAAETATKNRIAKTKNRTWTDRGQKFQVEAKMLDYDDGTVRLKRKDNDKIISIALEKLSPPDQNYVKITMAEFTDTEPDFLEYAAPDGSFKGRIAVTRFSAVPVVRTKDAPTAWSVAPDPAKIRKLDFKPKDLKFMFPRTAAPIPFEGRGAPAQPGERTARDRIRERIGLTQSGKQGGLLHFEGVHFCDGAPEKILTGISESGPYAPGTAAFVFGDTKTGALHFKTYSVPAKVFGLSSDGTKALLGHAAPDSRDMTYLAVVDTTRPQLPCIAAFQAWNRSRVAELDRADWVDENHILVGLRGGTAVLIRSEDGTPVWSVDAHDIAFSPGKKYFIASVRNKTCLLMESLTGKPLGRLAPARGGEFQRPAFAFSPDGKKIAVQENRFHQGGWVHIWDMQTGLPGQPFYVPGDFGANLTWVDDLHILCLGVTVTVLADTVERFPVWIYSDCHPGDVFFAGRLWHTSRPGHGDRTPTLGSAEVPHPDLPRLSPMTDAQKYGVRPGMKVTLTVDDAIPDSGKLRERVTKMLTDNGQNVVPNAPLTLAVRMRSERQVEVAYYDIKDYSLELIERGSRRGQGADRSTGKAIYTPYTYSFAFEQGGRALWTVRREMPIPDVSALELRGNKTLQDIVTEKTTPKSDWYFEVDLPPQIPFEKTGRSALFP